MNELGLMFFLAILPVVIILIYIYNKDKNKEPLSLLMTLFSLGIFSCFLVIEISQLLSYIFPFMKGELADKSFIDVLLYAFIGVALVEEFCKWLFLYLKGYKNNKNYDEQYDILVYSIFVSLGFACLENIIYVISGGISVAIMRALSAVPGHACDAIFMGYHLSMAKQYSIMNKKDLERKHLILSIVVPTILHGIYDFCLMSGYSIFVFIFFIFVIFLFNQSLKKVKEISEISKVLKPRNKFCPNCGSVVSGNFCGKCGTKQD